MKSKFLIRTCGIAAAGLIMAGCNADAPATTTATTPTIPVIPAETTIAVPETTAPASWLDGLMPGDIVWCIHHATAIDPAYARDYRFLARTVEYIIVSAQLPERYDSAEALISDAIEQTAEGWCNMYLFLIDDCCESRDEAWAAARAENRTEVG